MGVRFQVVIDCAEPEPLARFWAAALGYVLEPPPEGSPSGMTTTATSDFLSRSSGTARTA